MTATPRTRTFTNNGPETYTVIIDGKATAGLNIHEAYKLWRSVEGNVHMMKDSEYQQAE